MALEHNSDHPDNVNSRTLVSRISNSISLKIAVLGIVFFVSGFLVQFIEVSWTVTGVWAAVLGIWGAALFVLGLLLYSVVWWSYQ